MGSIGDLTHTTGSDMLKFRCPVGEAKVIEVSDQHAFTIGVPAVRSDMLLLPLQTSAGSDIFVAAYEVPRIVVDAFPASAIHTGQKLYHRTATNTWEAAESAVRCTAIALEDKAAGDSEVMVHFNGTPAWDQSDSDAVAITT